MRAAGECHAKRFGLHHEQAGLGGQGPLREPIDLDALVRTANALARTCRSPSRDAPHARPCTPGTPPGRLGANQEPPAARGAHP